MSEHERSIDTIPAREFLAADRTGDWRVVGDGAWAFYPTPSLDASVRLVAAVAAIPGFAAHRPAIDIRADGVSVRLLTLTESWFGMSTLDVELAAAISAVARDQGLAAEPAAVQSLLVIVGATSRAAVMPFWQALLGYEPRPDSPDQDLVDPHDRGPAVWFEEVEEPGPHRNQLHVAAWIAPELAEARVAAALAAGGRIVRDAEAPAGWLLADPEGNEADIATILTRD
jgi:4a-hydroxytetrahydrobiopterin dehydratase